MEGARYQPATQKQLHVANNISCLFLKVQTTAHLHTVSHLIVRHLSVQPVPSLTSQPCQPTSLSAYFNDLEIVSRGQASVNIFLSSSLTGLLSSKSNLNTWLWRLAPVSRGLGYFIQEYYHFLFTSPLL